MVLLFVTITINIIINIRYRCLFSGRKSISSKGLGSIRGYFGLNILGKLNTFVYLVLDLHNLNVITCF